MRDIFLARLFARTDPTRARVPSAEELESALGRLWEAARKIWPQVDLPAETFVNHLVDRLPPDGDLGLALENTHAGDLYLACACSQGHAKAIEAFERSFVAQVSRYLAGRDALPGFSDEVKQRLRARLLVAGGDLLPRIGGYTGRGSLGGFLRIAAARIAIDLDRSRERGHVPLDRADSGDADRIAPAVPDPELDFLQAQYGGVLRESLAATLSALSARESTLIRLFFLEGLTLAEIGALYGAAERTARKWIAQVRRKILEETRRGLGARLRASPSEVESLVRVLGANLDTSVLGALAAKADP